MILASKIRALFFRFSCCVTSTQSAHSCPSRPICYTSPHMDKDTKDILEAINFIKDHMVTKTDFDDAVEKLDDRLAAV